MKIALDAMGGDFAPAAVVEGAVLAAREILGAKDEIILVGLEKEIQDELKKQNVEGLNLQVFPATEVVGMDEHPAKALKTKPNSSIAITVGLQIKKKADASISAGNTGAMMAASFLGLGALADVVRPAIASQFPTILSKPTLVLDVGANADCKPMQLLQFAIMGSLYMETVVGVHEPKVGLLNIGSESTKGNELSVATYELLKKSKLNFFGNVEGYDILKGTVDVVVCEGFVGNVVLKFGESFIHLIKSKLEDDFWKDSRFDRLKKEINYEEHGGAPLLGINGISMIAHGASTPTAIKNGIRTTLRMAEQDINSKIRKHLELYGKIRGN